MRPSARVLTPGLLACGSASPFLGPLLRSHRVDELEYLWNEYYVSRRPSRRASGQPESDERPL